MTTQATPDVDALQTLLAIEHAAVHDYGLAGPYVPALVREIAQRLADVHRLQRDVLADAVRQREAEPVPPEPAYAPPARITSGGPALDALMAVEQRGIDGYRAAILQTANRALRKLYAELLTQSAVNITQLRLNRGHPAALATRGVNE